MQINNSPNFETKSSYNIRVQTKDAGGQVFEKELTIAVNNLDIPTRLTKVADDVFNIISDATKATLQVTFTESSSVLVNELGLYTVDDATGKINGISPGAAGYAQAALERSLVVFSSLANLPNGFSANDVSRLLQLDSSANLRFYLVKNSSTQSVLAGITPITDVLFSNSSTLKITDLGNNAFSLAYKDGSVSTGDFQSLVVKIQPTNDLLPLGTALQGSSQAEVIDLRGITQQVKAEFVVNREAAFNNFVGFYKVADENGGIDVNGQILRPGEAGYIQAAIRARVPGIDLTVNNQGTASFTGFLQPGSIFAPFIIVDGQPNAILDSNPNNDPAVYFPFLGANSDKTDHVRLLGNNIFGFEDLAGGGDKDFNDMVVRVNLTAIR
ncbi:FG-GAP repeat-containing protein [Cylindrospermum sp. NIES-4074]|nr:FG-GAP repeat-containing protein [Cylindrospermum sp. NIES-4074]